MKVACSEHPGGSGPKHTHTAIDEVSEVPARCGGENRNPLLSYLCFRAHLQGREPLGWQVRQRDMLAGCPGAAPTPIHTGEHQEMADGPHQNKHRAEVGPVGVFFHTPAARRHRENSEQSGAAFWGCPHTPVAASGT